MHSIAHDLEFEHLMIEFMILEFERMLAKYAAFDTYCEEDTD
jgi:hypothetical protein